MKKAMLVLLALLVLAVAGLYGYSSWLMRAKPSPLAFAALTPGDPVEGKRLASIAGCTSCHEPDLGGGEFIHIDNVVRLFAPDLTRARERYDDAGLLRLLRTGAKADGNYALGMPAQMQQRLTDREAADIIAFVRSVPLAPKPVQSTTAVYPLGRLGLVLGEYKAYEGDVPESAAVLLDRAEPGRGRHLAQIACTECHGAQLEGDPGIGAPSLAIAKAYDLAQFSRLMRTGVTRAGTESKTGLMSGVARARFPAFTEEELADLHAWLAAR
ncbi:MAG: c-type cytochrome [Arenimonas sp.]